MNWQPIETAPKDGQTIWARDKDMSRQTWFEDGVWICRVWREDADQQEFQCDEIWEPIQWVKEG